MLYLALSLCLVPLLNESLEMYNVYLQKLGELCVAEVPVPFMAEV